MILAAKGILDTNQCKACERPAMEGFNCPWCRERVALSRKTILLFVIAAVTAIVSSMVNTGGRVAHAIIAFLIGTLGFARHNEVPYTRPAILTTALTCAIVAFLMRLYPDTLWLHIRILKFNFRSIVTILALAALFLPPPQPPVPYTTLPQRLVVQFVPVAIPSLWLILVAYIATDLSLPLCIAFYLFWSKQPYIIRIAILLTTTIILPIPGFLPLGLLLALLYYR